ncbi:MAG: DUF1501 domain-containing protein [Planctomycetota bacterium]
MNPMLAKPIPGHSRRDLLRALPGGMGAAALAMLGGPARQAQASPGLPSLPHFAARAKRVIYLCQSGGPSHIDLWDYKPRLAAEHGEDLPADVMGTQRLTGMTSAQARFRITGPLAPFRQRGESGRWVSDLLPHTGALVDELCVIKSLRTEAINHDPGITFLTTGTQLNGAASLGAWLSYGLGSENANFPAYIVLISQGTGKNPGQPIFSRLWGSGFLPSKHQGVRLRAGANPVLHLANTPGVDRPTRRRMLDDLKVLNASRLEQTRDREVETWIAQHEMAFRMQASVPDLVDLSGESESVYRSYGEDARRPGTYAANCLLARRLCERGVRCVQLFHRGWDQHKALDRNLRAQCRDTDRATAALLSDLKHRGLLDETLVVWAGEFGRTAYSQGKLGSGRDHHGRCFTVWMAGGGVKPGVEHGATDEYAYNIASDAVDVRDFNATLLNCLGIDHRRFAYLYQGLEQRLTGVEPATPVRAVLA